MVKLRLPFPSKFQRLAEKLAQELEKKQRVIALDKALTTSPNRPFQNYVPMGRKKKRSGARAAAVSSTSLVPAQPDEIKCNSVVKSKYRYASIALQAATTITVKNLLEAMGQVQTDATHVQSVFSCVRIKKVQIWGPAAAAGGHADISVRWATGGNNVVDDVKTNTTISTANSCYYESTPPPNTFSSMWWDSAAAATVLFDISCPANAIVDVMLEGRLRNSIAQPTTTVVVVAKTVGTLFYGYLDGPATANFFPEGRPS